MSERIRRMEGNKSHVRNKYAKVRESKRGKGIKKWRKNKAVMGRHAEKTSSRERDDK